ncbi:hypothetical protein ACNKHO_25565 [Shigella flexneri]
MKAVRGRTGSGLEEAKDLGCCSSCAERRREQRRLISTEKSLEEAGAE